MFSVQCRPEAAQIGFEIIGAERGQVGGVAEAASEQGDFHLEAAACAIVDLGVTNPQGIRRLEVGDLAKDFVPFVLASVLDADGDDLLEKGEKL